MTNLIDALRTNDAVTENGMVTNSTTLNMCVDLFFQIGALRGQERQRKINVFTKAFAEDSLTAMKILFWARDIRGGAGERSTFKDIIIYLANNKTEVLRKNLSLIPEYGRWDDLLVLLDTKLKSDVIDLISKSLKSGNGLTAKWLPRGNTKNRDNKRYAKILREELNLSPSAYRKMLVELSNTVEQLMCAKDFDKITYEHVPSKAMSDYMKAFTKNDGERFKSYLDSLSKGEVKINTGAIYPYDVVKNLKHGSDDGATLQWNSLPNYMEGNNEMVLPMVDVSGSMTCSAGGNPNVTCLDVALSLGLYISERNEGPFKDAFFTFSSKPELQYLKGDLKDRFNQLRKAHWEMNTNLEATFTELLKKAKASNVAPEDMPTMILILSDMEFDSATSTRWGRGSDYNVTAQEMINNMYSEAGYKTPKIVYWNIQSRRDNNPVQFNKEGVAMVSGFSPALLKTLLAGKNITPYNMMMDIIGSERYNPITV